MLAALGLGLASGATLSASAQPRCEFQLGFLALQRQIPGVVGDCLEPERRNGSNGNTEQRTTGGLLVWRKADNLAAFTDGSTTWINGPGGVVSRPNGAEPFSWEGVGPTAPSAQPLLVDSFDDPMQARLPTNSREPARYQRGYRDGQYLIVKSDPAWVFTPTAELPGTFGDATLSVEARLVGELQDRYIMLACRASKATDSHYRFGVQPGPGRFELSRWDGGDRTALVAWRTSTAIRRGTEWNELELSCQGTTIRALANGVELARVEDATYARGELWIGAGAFVEARVTAEARFDNLVVTVP